jgi:hypothetical protein
MHRVRLLAPGLLRLPGHGMEVLRPTSRDVRPDRTDPVHDALRHVAKSEALWPTGIGRISARHGQARTTAPARPRLRPVRRRHRGWYSDLEGDAAETSKLTRDTICDQEEIGRLKGGRGHEARRVVPVHRLAWHARAGPSDVRVRSMVTRCQPGHVAAIALQYHNTALAEGAVAFGHCRPHGLQALGGSALRFFEYCQRSSRSAPWRSEAQRGW